MKKYNLSKDFSNYSQRNNEVVPNSSCGPTNMIQALEYAGWEWDNSIFPELKQPEDKLTKFTRTNKDVLAYYESHYGPMYRNWLAEAERLAKEQKKEIWQVDCKDSYAPNEVHDVMSYAVNLFIGYSVKELAKLPRRPVTRFYNEFDEADVVNSLVRGKPVVSSVNFNNCGHYVTIVGFEAEDSFDENVAKGAMDSPAEAKANCSYIKKYIIDNTYGKFDFVNKKYIAVSGNDEEIERSKFLSIVKPVTHYFSKGAATCC